MSFSQQNGYIPQTFNDIMNEIRTQINGQFGTSYTESSFVGTSWYKYMYGLVQYAQKNEIKTSEIFQKLQQYIALTNESIQRPSVSFPGLIDSFESNGYMASVKPPLETDAGKVSICVNVDDTAPDYADTKLAINTLISQFVAAGLVLMGDQTSSIVIKNGQAFNFSYFLPDKTPILLRATIAVSENNLLTLPTDEQVRQIIFDNTNARYKLGLNFEPQRYFNLSNAPYAQTVLLEYSINAGSSWVSTVHDADFDELYTYGLADISVLGL